MSKTLVGIIIGALAITGCSSRLSEKEIVAEQLEAQQLAVEAEHLKSQEALDSVPDWVINAPKNDRLNVYGVGMGKSVNLDTAIKKAALKGQYELAKAMKQELSGNERSFDHDNGSYYQEDFKVVIDSFVDSVPIQGYKTIRNKVMVQDGKYVAYTLVSLSYEQYQRTLDAYANTIAGDTATESFAELRERVDAKSQN